MMRQTVALAALVACAAATAPAVRPDIARVLEDHFKFTPAELAELGKGRVVRHAIDSSAPGEMAVVGAVRVRAPIRRLLDSVRNISEFKRGPGVLEIGRFSDPPAAADLDRLTVTRDDFDANDCRVGDCGVRLPADMIKQVPHDGNGDGSGHEAPAAWFKEILLEHVRAYWSGTSGRITRYDHGARPIKPSEEFDGILRNAPALAALVPQLPAHLSHFPSQRIGDAEDFLYWSKERFGMSPFITVTQITIVCPSVQLCVVASKDVYSSRYIDASLGITIASLDDGDPDAFYLVYANRSRASALKGMFSGLRKTFAERRARGGLEETLRTVKTKLESP
jgi:hypothetical protein